MTTVTEAMGAAQTQMKSALDAGLDTISLKQTIPFVKYVKMVLPVDGYVFWIRSDLAGAGAMQNKSQVGPKPVNINATFNAAGSIHLATDRRQEANQTAGINSLVFTSEVEIQPLNEVSPVVMFLGSFEGIRFAFARRSSYYKQADLHHYIGEAVYPAMESQIIDDITEINQKQVVSNSLPAWLSLTREWPFYPSFLVPDNMQPPYGVVHIPPESLRAIEAFPTIDRHGNHSQLVSERVEITLFGVRNDEALDFIDRVNEFSLNLDLIGIMNMPVMRDEQHIQAEVAALAIKKKIVYEVSYRQQRLNDIARQFILQAVPVITTPDL